MLLECFIRKISKKQYYSGQKSLSPCQADPVCSDKVKTGIMSKPVEECDMEPGQVCRQVTKLVPGLQAQEECVQVPKEICSVYEDNDSEGGQIDT